MFETIETAPLIERSEFVGTIRSAAGDVPNCTLGLEFEPFNSTLIKGFLAAPSGAGTPADWFRSGLRFAVAYPATTIVLRGFPLTELGATIRFSAQELKMGALDADAGEGRTTPLRVSLCGIRDTQKDSAQKGITFHAEGLRWASDGIQFELGDETHGGTETRVGVHVGEVSLTIPTIRATCTIKDKLTFDELVERVAKHADEAALLLSLASRQRVDWYRIGTWPGKLIEKRRAVDADNVVGHNPSDDLIDTAALSDVGFGSLVNGLRDAGGGSGPIGRTIWFLGESRRVAPVTNQFLLAYVAFETIVSSFKNKGIKAPRYSSADVDALRDVVKAALSSVPNADLKATAMQNLNDLHRRTFADDLAAVITSTGVRTSDLWPQSGVAAGHARARQSRNDLVHRGVAVDEDLLEGDILRVRSFAERLVLAALKWPPERVGRFADSQLEFRNSVGDG